MNKIVFFIFIFLLFKKFKSNNLTVNIELIQVNSSIKVNLQQIFTKFSSHGIIILPYSYSNNSTNESITINRKLNLGSLTLTEEIISVIIPFSIYDIELTFPNSTINVGNDKWDLKYSNNTIKINTPLIKLDNVIQIIMLQLF